ncbi:MAG: ABC transporter permease [Calditrichaeota bacterium]|nr:MAG: ABC transporter permease [Calditrichota bacterium]
MLLRLAWRNLWRNKRRTLLTMAAISFATLLAIATRGVQLGTYQANIRHSLELFTGYLQIVRPGFQSNPSLYKSFTVDSGLVNLLASQPAVTGWTARLQSDGLVSSGEKSLGGILLGLDRAREKRVSTLFNRLDRGRWFSGNRSREAVLGYRLLKNLNLDIGQEIVVLSQGFDGSLGNEKYRVVGTVRTGAMELDQMAVLLPLESLQELLAMPGRVTQVVVALKRVRDIPRVQRVLQSRLKGQNLAVLSWEELLPELKESIELDNIGGLLSLAIVVLVVGFGVLNTVLMSVTERFREFGILLAVGMANSVLVRVVALEILLLSTAGILLGNGFGWLVNYYLVLHPVEFTGTIGELYREFGFIPRMYSTVDPGIFVHISLTMVAVSLVASAVPLYKIQRLEPLKGIRYT